MPPEFSDLARLGGKARTKATTPEKRKEIASRAARVRWGKEEKVENIEQIVNSLCLSQQQASSVNLTGQAVAENTVMLSTTTSNGFTGAYTQTNSADNCVGGCLSGYTYVYPSYPWWPQYWPVTYEDRTQRAFRTVKVLIDKKIIKLKSIKEFVDLVDEIAKIV